MDNKSVTRTRGRVPRRGTDDGRPGVSRRRFLGAVGAGTAVLAAPSVGSASALQTKGKLVFIYDDGYREDYTQTFRVHEREGVPGCVAIPSINIGRNEQFLTKDQVDTMVEAGWEVMSHGRAHEKLGPAEVVQDVAQDDERVYVNSVTHARTPNPIEIYTGDKRAEAEIAGSGEDDTGNYIELTSAVGKSFSAGEGPQLRFTEEVTRAVLQESKQMHRDKGYDTTNLVLPYDYWDQRTLELIPEYYDAVANVYIGGMNGGAASDPYRLRRDYYRPGLMTEDELASFLDQAQTTNALAILTAHSRHSEMTGDRTLKAIQMAKDRDLDIVTLQTALEEFGIVESSGGPGGQGNETTTGNGTVGTETRDGGGDDGGGIPIIDGFVRWLLRLFDGLFG